MPRQSSAVRRIGLLAWLAPLLLAAVAGLMLLPGSARGQSASTVSVGDGGDLGSILVGDNGHTLYIFTPDEPGVSNCNGGCATAWPPLTVSDGATPTAGPGVSGTLALITRDDGSQQVALDGQPLYYFASDNAPGDTNGQGVNDVWFVVSVEAPAAAPVAPPDAGNAGLSVPGGGATVWVLLLSAAAAGMLVLGARSLTRRRDAR